MKQNIICPYCNGDNDCSEIPQTERTPLYCFDCDEEIGEVIPKLDFFYEFCHFIFNCLIYVFLIGSSAYFFENYPDWKNPSGFILAFSIMIASIALHEFFHAFSAFLLGDYSVFGEGYLRLNIFKYIQGVNSIFLPALIFLFIGVFLPGAAVYIREENIRHRISNFIVDISGVFSQVIFICAILILINSGIYSLSNDFKSILHVSVFLQAIILLSNLLPIPGYDGWNAIFSLIGKEIGQMFSKLFFLPLTIGIICVVVFDLFPDELGFIFLSLIAFANQLGLDENLIASGWSYLQLIDIETLDLFRERVSNFLVEIGEIVTDQL